MQITKGEIEHIARLARLFLSDEEQERFGSELSSILDYMKKLNELDTSAVQPTSHVLSLQNVTRDDLVRQSITRDEALSNAPSHTGKFYRVPKIIE